MGPMAYDDFREQMMRTPARQIGPGAWVRLPDGQRRTVVAVERQFGHRLYVGVRRAQPAAGRKVAYGYTARALRLYWVQASKVTVLR